MWKALGFRIFVMSKKLSKDIVNERLLDRGIKLVGEYVNTSTKTTFECKEGHKWDAKPNDVMSGNGCPHCAGKAPLSKEIVNERIADRGIKLVGDYVKSSTKTTFECKEGHKWDAKPSSVMSGKGCPHCAGKAPLSKEIVNDRIADRGIKLVGEYVNTSTKTTFECKEGHKWDAKPNDVMRGSGCPHCAGQAPLSKEIVNERLLDRGIKLIGAYVNTFTKATFECKEGHQWDATPDNVMSGKGCPHCSRQVTDANVFYIWRASEHKNLYKVGISSERVGTKRINQVAKDNGLTPKIVLHVVTTAAREIERMALSLGEQPTFILGDGHTEFRYYTEVELAIIMKAVDAA